MKTKKTIGNFKMWLWESVSKDGEECFLNIKINDDLKALLKTAIINETQIFNHMVGVDNNRMTIREEMTRYKVKSVFYRDLYHGDKDLLFTKELLDKGQTKVKFASMDTIEQRKSNLWNNLRVLCKTLLNIGVKQLISFPLEVEK